MVLGHTTAKCYVGYYSSEFLGHHVDRFGLSSLEQKVEVIAVLHFRVDVIFMIRFEAQPHTHILNLF